MASLDVNDDLALMEECVGMSSHLWYVLSVAINVESRLFHELDCGRDANTQHVDFFAAYFEIILLFVESQHIDLFEVVVGQGIDS
jgi:hypothetical protein